MNKVGYISNVLGGRGLIDHGSHGSSRMNKVGFFLGVLRSGGCGFLRRGVGEWVSDVFFDRKIRRMR